LVFIEASLRLPSKTTGEVGRVEFEEERGPWSLLERTQATPLGMTFLTA
jgi:hypothetical protein